MSPLVLLAAWEHSGAMLSLDSDAIVEPASSQAVDAARWEQCRELMIAAQRGDRTAYRDLLLAVTPYIRRIAARHVPRDEVEDAIQEVLLVIHDIRHTYEPVRPFKPWLSTIASRRCVDLLRRKSTRSRHEMLVDEDLDFVPDLGAGPEEAASREETMAQLHDAIAQLPQRQREAVKLLQIEELSANEASEKCAQTPGALKVACHRALKTLKGVLASKGGPHE